jgi:H+/Cl- antiporter ClcA
MTPLIFVSTAITHLLGGSAGREGAALQIGGSIGSQLGRTFRLDEDDKRILTMCGMSAAFAALFNTPVAAAFFAMEVISVGIFHYSAIVACVISAVVADGISKSFGSAPFSADVVFPEGNAEVYIKILLLIVLCSLLSIFFCISMGAVSIAYKKIKNSYIRAALGGSIVALLTFVVGTYDYNGAGSGVIERAFTEPANPEAFILKIAFTALTLCAGFKGGEIVPSFFIGATLGCVISPLLGIDAGVGASVCMIALFCGVVNCPIASVFIATELFGAQGILFYTIACAVSYIMSGYFSLYKEQHFVYSKLTAGLYDK